MTKDSQINTTKIKSLKLNEFSVYDSKYIEANAKSIGKRFTSRLTDY